jgi:hypothetical protein
MASTQVVSVPTADLIIRTTVLEWSPPTERFSIYEKSDEEWCRYFGIGELTTTNYVSTILNLRLESEEYDQMDRSYRIVLAKGMSSMKNDGDEI